MVYTALDPGSTLHSAYWAMMSGSFSDDVRLLLWVVLTHVVTSYLVRPLLIVCTYQIVEMPIQWATKLFHKKSNFTCVPNCGSEDKGKIMRKLHDKGKYPTLWYAKLGKFSPSHWFNIDFTMWSTRWNGFVACACFGPFGLSIHLARFSITFL